MGTRLTSIVAIDRHGAIGCRNSLPWKLKSDMAFFRSKTLGHTVIMGRKTYESIGSALPGRKNVVLSHNAVLFPSTPDCTVGTSIIECLAIAQRNRSREVFVVGGAATYSEFAHLVDRYLVTIVDHEASDADTFLSAHVTADIRSWPSNELAAFPASVGADQYAFKVYEMDAPDAEERQADRQAMVASWLIKKQKIAASQRLHGAPFSGSQEAFAF